MITQIILESDAAIIKTKDKGIKVLRYDNQDHMIEIKQAIILFGNKIMFDWKKEALAS